MAQHKQPAPPKDLSGYLEALARVMFQAGSWYFLWSVGRKVPARHEV